MRLAGLQTSKWFAPAATRNSPASMPNEADALLTTLALRIPICSEH